ncbi:MAG: pyrroline-5-carboxylate reductase [Rickettsiales bacterium]|nr:pyrroline-5-carboxylate reductase [Rickettsiales bacterium]
MDKGSTFFDDLSKLATGAAGSFREMGREMEKTVRHQVDAFLERSNLVTREEFEVVRAMAEKARAENEQLRIELEALKNKAS